MGQDRKFRCFNVPGRHVSKQARVVHYIPIPYIGIYLLKFILSINIHEYLPFSFELLYDPLFHLHVSNKILN